MQQEWKKGYGAGKKNIQKMAPKNPHLWGDRGVQQGDVTRLCLFRSCYTSSMGPLLGELVDDAWVKI